MKRFISLLVTFMMLFALLTGCSKDNDTSKPNTESEQKASSEEGNDFPELSITIATTHPNNEEDSLYLYCKTLADIVTEKTDGKVTFDIIGDSVLGDDTEIAQGIAMGTLQMGVTSSAAVSSYEACHQFLGLPFIFDDYEDAHVFLDSDISAEMNELLYDDGLKVLNVLDGGFRECLNTTRPITDVDSFDGLKWRVVPQDMWITMFNLLGANSTPMSGAEVFTGLQQGTIDGCEFPVSSIYSMQLYTATKYLDMTNHIFAAWYCCMSDELWESFSPELQQIFVDAGKEANEVARQADQDSVEVQLSAIEEAGVQVNRNVDTTNMRAAVEPMYANYRDAIGADIYDRAMAFIKSMH